MEKNLEHNKYKMFRNFMCNELGITKEDIKQWTKDSVAETARKLVEQINLKEIVELESRKAIKAQYGSPDVVKAIADVLAKQISLTLKNEK